MRLVNLEGTFFSHKRENLTFNCIEAEGNEYFISASNAHHSGLKPGMTTKFCAIVEDSCSGDLCVFVLGHAPQEYRDVVVYGCGEDSGMPGKAVVETRDGKRYEWSIEENKVHS